MNQRHIILRFDAPLMSFGGVAIDNFGVTDAWPAASLITGLLGNALGYLRTDADKLQYLQDRMVFACRADREGGHLRDFQTAELGASDKGWTTHGVPEGRAGGAGTYAGMHMRYRDYWADRIVTIALRLEPADADPDLVRVADALRHPARPLFLGRKPCLPSAPVFAGWADGESALDAIARVPLSAPGRHASPGPADIVMAVAPVGDTPHGFHKGRQREIRVSGCRNWQSGVHGGAQRWLEGRLAVSVAQAPE